MHRGPIAYTVILILPLKVLLGHSIRYIYRTLHPGCDNILDVILMVEIFSLYFSGGGDIRDGMDIYEAVQIRKTSCSNEPLLVTTDLRPNR